jgi:tetratricopeptide (TPR) repeat protein
MYREYILLGLVVLGIAGSIASAAPREAIEEELQEASALQKLGKPDQAVEVLEGAHQNAEDPELRYDASMKLGQVKASMAQTQKESGSTDFTREYDAALKHFGEALQSEVPAKRAAATNNIAVIYLKRGNAEGALEALEKISADDFAANERFAFHYNRGRAFEVTKNRVEAVTNYTMAFKDNPQFLPAAERAWDLLSQRNADQVQLPLVAYDLGRSMLSQGYIARVQSSAVDALKANAAADGTRPYLALILEANVAAKMTPDAIARFWQSELSEVAPSAADEVAKACDEFRNPEKSPREFQSSAVAAVYPWWCSSGDRDKTLTSFATFLRHIGDSHAGVGVFPALDDRSDSSFDAALNYYLEAWTLDPENLQAAQNIAWVLSQYSESSEHALGTYNQFQDTIDGLFRVKGALYADTDKSPADWQRLLRMHMLLGTIFEKKGIWGHEDEPRSAIFQWNHALTVELKLREEAGQPQFRAPGLHERLGKAYAAVGKNNDAIHHYGLASETYMANGDRQSGQACMEALKALTPDNP